MPTNTFYGLPKEKQERLLEAARIEFSRVSLNEASVSNIIKLAEIPRGSFYQYFENLEDLYYYYFDQLRHDTREEFKKAIEEAEGDILLGAENYFSKMICEILTGENAAFFKNLFMNMDYRSSRHMTSKLDLPDVEKMRRNKRPSEPSLWESVVDPAKLRFKDKHDFSMFMHMLMTQVFMTIANGYRLQNQEDFQLDELITDFRTQLSWFRDGIYVEKEGK